MTTPRYLLGLDIGSSFVKASLLDVDRGAAAASASAPASEMTIASPRPGWAEQQPDDWWANAVLAALNILSARNPQICAHLRSALEARM